MKELLQQALDEGWTLTDRIKKSYSVQDFINKYGEDETFAFVFAESVRRQEPKKEVAKPKPKRTYKHRVDKRIVLQITVGKKDDGKEQYVPIYFSLLNNQKFRESHRCKLSLYLFLRMTAARVNPKKSYDHILQKVYNRYGVENKIASSWSYPELAKKFGYKGTTMIKEWIDELWTEGAFEITTIDVGKPEPQNVYIVGEWINGHAYYYLDMIMSGQATLTETTHSRNATML